MQVQRKSYQVRGFVRLADYALRWAHMITDKAKRKARILVFWQEYGLKAAIAAFEIKKRSLYNWKRQLKEGGGHLESLNDKKRAPKNKRRRIWHPDILAEIKRLRFDHPNLGKKNSIRLSRSFAKQSNSFVRNLKLLLDHQIHHFNPYLYRLLCTPNYLSTGGGT